MISSRSFELRENLDFESCTSKLSFDCTTLSRGRIYRILWVSTTTARTVSSFSDFLVIGRTRDWIIVGIWG